MATTTTNTQRTYYNEDIDFAALAKQDADFAAILDANKGRVDWQDPKAVQWVATCNLTTSNETSR